jgi:hypothetical protein
MQRQSVGVACAHCGDVVSRWWKHKASNQELGIAGAAKFHGVW